MSIEGGGSETTGGGKKQVASTAPGNNSANMTKTEVVLGGGLFPFGKKKESGVNYVPDTPKVLVNPHHAAAPGL